ncbi:MAG: hypothetical protein ACI9J5_001891, partial [Paraglaciecola sp.]
MLKIALQANSGQYVCAEGSGGREVVANRGVLGPWETFIVHDLDGGEVALQANNGQYLCAEGGGGREVVANRNAIGAWETFTRHDLGDNKFAFQAANGQYMCAESGGGQIIVANRGAIGSWETFVLTTVAGTSRNVAVDDEEKAQIKETADITKQLLARRYLVNDDKVLRGVHPKSHGCVMATFKINDDIDHNLQVGLFSVPGQCYQAKIRYSNATALVTNDVNADGTNSSRGMAIKVLAVEDGGPFLEKDNGNRNQDFLMINSPVFAFANIPDYLRLNQSLLNNNESAAEFFAPLAPDSQFTEEQIATAAATFSIIRQISATPVENPLAVQYFSAAPFAFGATRVMHFSVVPSGGAKTQQKLLNPTANYLREAVTETMSTPEHKEFDFMVQIRNTNEEGLELENASENWDQTKYPFVKVATISIPSPQQEINSEKNEAECENLVYTPWHALKAH